MYGKSSNVKMCRKSCKFGMSEFICDMPGRFQVEPGTAFSGSASAVLRRKLGIYNRPHYKSVTA